MPAQMFAQAMLVGVLQNEPIVRFGLVANLKDLDAPIISCGLARGTTERDPLFGGNR